MSGSVSFAVLATKSARDVMSPLPARRPNPGNEFRPSAYSPRRRFKPVGSLQFAERLANGVEVRQIFRRGSLLAVLHDAVLVDDEGRARRGGTETAEVI